MPFRKKTLYFSATCTVSGLLALTLFGERYHSEIAEPPQLFASPQQVRQTAEQKQEISAPATAANSALRQQHPVIRQAPDRILQLEEALQSKDEAAIRSVVTKVDSCPNCLEHIAAFLEDPSRDLADKIALGRALIQSGTQAETMLLVNAILHAHVTEESDLKDGLLQVLADAQTQESVAALMAIITGETGGQEFQQLPEDLQYAIQKAIRLNPNRETTGQMLAGNYNSQPLPEVAEKLQDVQHPMMISLLAKEAYEAGDISRAEQLMELFSAMNDPRTLDGLMLLTEKNVMPLDEANGRAYTWVSEHGDNFDQDHYAAYLSDFDANTAQRSIAAFALAASQNSEDALAALEKAYNHESDSLVRSNLESAINLVLNRSNPQ
jgi:hypothetical protein